jgi:hypothetical protein
MVETRGDAMRDRAFKRVVVEDIHGEEQRELRLAPPGFLSLLPDPRKQRVGACDPNDSGGQTLRHDELPNRRPTPAFNT